MRCNRYRAICFFLAIALISASAFSGCSRVVAPDSVVRSLVENEKNRVSGRFYSLSAAEGEEGYVSDVTLTTLYGFDRSLEGLADGAIYLSDFLHPIEFAVFFCHSTATTEDVALRLTSRLKALYKGAYENAGFASMPLEEYRAYVEDAEVVISGELVALIISADTESAKKVFFRAS